METLSGFVLSGSRLAGWVFAWHNGGRIFGSIEFAVARERTEIMHVTYTLRRAASISGDGTALLEGDLRRTWSEVASRVQKMAGALQGLGIGDGDPVAVLTLNSHRYFELHFSPLWAGGVVVPLNTRLAAPELIFQMNDCRAKVLVVDDAFLPMLPAFRKELETVEHYVYADDGDTPEGLLDYETLLAKGEAIPDAGRNGDDVMGVFYTGGTTGRSKGVLLTHDNIVINAMNATVSLKYDPSDIYLHAAPMFHLADGASTFAFTMAAGTHVFIKAFEPELTLRTIQQFGVTRVTLVPTMINMVINHPTVGDFDLSSLRAILYGASPIPTAMLRQAMSTLKCDFAQGYGMTELSPLATVLWPEDHRHDEDSPLAMRLKSAGTPVPTAEVCVMDDDNNELPQGEVGEICVRGPMVMKGYLNMPEATAEAIRDGWMHTGDMGYADEHGFFYLVDRSKDMIISGGENIYSVEVESAIYQHSAVLEAAVVGIPNEQWGEAVHAVVVLKPGASATEKELIEQCHALIAGYKCPKSVSFEEEPLPKSGAGKILKRDLRAPFWEGSDRQIH